MIPAEAGRTKLVKRLRYIFLTHVLTLGAFIADGQGSLDSLSRLLKSAETDSGRFEVLYQLSEAAEFTDYEQSQGYAEEARKLAETLGPWALGKIYLRLAFLETMAGDYSEALQYDLNCAALYAQSGDSTNLAKAYIDIGNDYRDMGNYDDAYYYHTESFRIARKAKPPTGRDSLLMAVALHNMGTVFAELGQYELSYQHFMASERLSAAISDEQAPAYTRDEVGELYRKQGDYQNAEKNLLEAVALARKLKIRVLVPRTRIHLANLYLDKGDYAKALLYFDSVRTDQRIINNRFTLAECNLGSGQALARLGRYEEAMKLLQESLKASLDLNAKILELSNYNALASLYEGKKDFQHALEFHRRHDALRDSLYSKSTMEKIVKEEVRFQTMNKDLEIQALSEIQARQFSEIQRQELIQNILVVVAVLAIILLYTVYRSGRRRKRINALLLEHQDEIKRRSVELQQLNEVKDKFFSIISHDLRSPMNALAGTLDLLTRQKITPDEFANLTETLRTQFNHTRTLITNLLDWTLLQMDKLKVHPEPVNVAAVTDESYQALKTLYPKEIHFENRVDPQLTGLGDRNIINLILRNLILNAIKFTEPGGKIWVEANTKGDELMVSVSDTGIGIKPEAQEFLFTKTSSYTTRGTANEKGTGIGLILCKEFVEKIGGKIGFDSKSGEGSTFYFTLPKAHTTAERPQEAIAP